MPDPYSPMFGSPITGWYRWFAWRPVETVDRGWRWLRIVHKRRISKHSYLPGGRDFWFQHAVTVPVDRGVRVVVSEYRVVHECGFDLATGDPVEAEEMRRGHECPPHASTPASATDTSE